VALSQLSSQTSDTALSDLAARAAGVRWGEVPEGARRHAALVLADTLGVIVGGSASPEVRALTGTSPLALACSKEGGARVLSPSAGSYPPEIAALINGTGGTWLELDEGVRPTGHPAINVVPAALAVGQAVHASGQELLAAVVSGYEVAGRLFRAYRLRPGVHPHGNLGAAGAAVAVARLLGADPGPAALTAAGLPFAPAFEACFAGATVRNTYAGMAGMIGVLANRLAAAGFTPLARACEISFGEILGEHVDSDALTADVDPLDLAICRNYFKLHSTCALAQAAIDATRALTPPAADQIDEIQVHTVANNMKIARQPVANELSTRFSIEYAVATAVVHGHADPAAFTPDERVLRLAARVQVFEDPGLTAQWPERSPARVRIRAGGETREATVENPRGHHANPPSESELRGKFASLVARAGAAGPACDYDRLVAIEQVDDVAELSVEAAR
jgi:2-methylcitrate dehydratase PrpD